MIVRKSIKKRFICVLFLILFLFTSATEANAQLYWPEGPSIQTPSAIVIEINSGAVLYEKNSTDKSYPASITKIMTTMLALEYTDMDELVEFSDDAIRYNQGDTSHIARDYGEIMTMEQCLYAVMLESANECAYAVAEHVGKKLGGDYQTFIDLMNKRAKDLGCTNTHFNNANGLPDSNHWTSAKDMALISAAAYKSEAFRDIISTRSYRIAPTNKHSEITPLNNHHAMISNYKTTKYLYKYCTGGKTGYTDAAGATLVTFAENNGLALVCVVMKTDRESQYTETTRLLEYCFNNFQSVSIGKSGATMEEEKKEKGIFGSYQPFVTLAENARVVLPVTADSKDVKMSVASKELPEGVVAQLLYTYGGHTAGCVDVVFSKAKVEGTYFEKKGEESANVIEIDFFDILKILVVLAVVLALVWGCVKLYDNYYVILHKIRTKKQNRDRFRPVKKRKKRRSRRRNRRGF